MLRYLLIPFLLFQFIPVRTQGPLGSWTDHLPYHSVNLVVAGHNEIYGSTDYAITIFNREYNETRKLSTVNGLSECGISTIAYAEHKEVLIIAYESGNIDIYDNGIVSNVPDILNTSIAGDKSANRIRTYGNYAYIAAKPGIIILDIDKKEIKDTWNPSADGEQNEVFDLAIFNDTVFAATEKGLFKASAGNPGLSYFRNWEIIKGASDGKYNAAASAGNRLFINKYNAATARDSVFYYAEGRLNHLPGLPAARNLSFEPATDGIIISSGKNVTMINVDGDIERLISEYGEEQIDARNAVMGGNEMFIADRAQGLVMLDEADNYASYIPEGPYFNNCYSFSASGGEVWVTGGRVNAPWNNTWSTFMIFNFANRQWSSIMRYDSWDVMRIAQVPGEPGHIYASTWGSGVYEYNNMQLVNHWEENSLESIIPGRPYVRVCGLAVDREKNLWITQSGIQNNIKVLTEDRSWISLPYYIDAPTIGDIIITESNLKWIVLPRGHGLFVLDDNNTPSYFDDDRYKKLAVKDQDGKLLSNIYSIAEDLDGNIWIGTDMGPAVFYNPNQVFDQAITANRIKVPRNDGTGLADYLLGTETVLSIAVDGGNRKWLGTNSSGAFLISENSNELIKSYNTSNSPLLSDQVMALATEESTGEVWFGTGKGIITVRETGTRGSDKMEAVYAYPNPVYPDYTGNVTIKGLSRNTNVKITDVSGNLVYETKSTGGDASWDMTTYNGRKVSTGVYIVLCNNEDGSVSATAKILIIR